MLLGQAERQSLPKLSHIVFLAIESEVKPRGLGLLIDSSHQWPKRADRVTFMSVINIIVVFVGPASYDHGIPKVNAQNRAEVQRNFAK